MLIFAYQSHPCISVINCVNRFFWGWFPKSRFESPLRMWCLAQMVLLSQLQTMIDIFPLISKSICWGCRGCTLWFGGDISVLVHTLALWLFPLCSIMLGFHLGTELNPASRSSQCDPWADHNTRHGGSDMDASGGTCEEKGLKLQYKGKEE